MSTWKSLAAALTLCAFVVPISACEKSTGDKVSEAMGDAVGKLRGEGDLERAGRKIGEALDDAGGEIKELIDDAKEAIE